MADKDERVSSRARTQLPEEKAAGSDDAVAQSEAILDDSDTRSIDRDAAPGTVLERRTSDDVTEPLPD